MRDTVTAPGLSGEASGCGGGGRHNRGTYNRTVGARRAAGGAVRVAELERRLEEQRTNFNNHVSVHNKSIKKHTKLVKAEMAIDAKNLKLATGMVTDDAIKKALTSMIEPAPEDVRSREKALKGPKPMKYMDADGNPVKERPSSTTGTGRGEISSSDDSDSDPEP